MIEQYPDIPWSSQDINNKIAAAVYRALVYMDGLSVEEKAAATRAHMRDLSVLAPLDDTDLIPSSFCKPYVKQPNVVRVNTSGKLAVAIVSLQDHFRQRTGNISHAEFVLRHTDDTLEMQKSLKFRELRRALVITDLTGSEVTWRAMALGIPRSRTTKLKFAASLVGAREPSDEDIQNLQTVGYDSLGDLIRHIRAYNQTPDTWDDGDDLPKFIPLPLSFRPQYKSLRRLATEEWMAEPRWEQVAERHCKVEEVEKAA